MWETFEWTEQDRASWLKIKDEVFKVFSFKTVEVNGYGVDCIITQGIETVAIIGGVDKLNALRGAAHYIMAEVS